MPLRQNRLFFKRSIVVSVLISLFSSILPVAQVAEAVEFSRPRPGGGLETIREVETFDTLYGLVAILVDEETWNASVSGTSRFSFLGNSKLSEYIETYAEDVQNAIPYTKSLIIKVSEEDGTPEIHKMLERLYLEGDPNQNDRTKLIGTVIIGENVPLPVVSKNGESFLSMLPYTDFAEPSYILDDATLDFVPNAEVQNVQADIWHGVIVPPVSGQNGYDLLGAYFTKNHAYHSGDELYTEFDQKVFLGDFIDEASTINSVSFDSYERFLDSWEEIAFYQYSGSLLETLMSRMESSIEPTMNDGFENIDNDGDGLIDEDGFEDNNNDADFLLYIPETGQYINWPDQRTDEDPPGDTNGDGCPGVCGVDDNGFSLDLDGDGYPTGFELVFGYDPYDSKRPHKKSSVYIPELMQRYYGVTLSFEDDDEAFAWASEQFVDGFWKDYFLHSSCYDSDGVARPEWDDDEDGFCDEDGSSEIPAGETCAYNDADCDGLIDEDPGAFETYDDFASFPDIQSKQVIDNLISRYTDLFEGPQGVWNRFIKQSGRYKVQELDMDSNVVNEYDSAVSLISKKDDYVLQYLDQLNRHLETRLDELVENELQVEIPLIGAVEIYAELVDEDDSTIKACNELAVDPSLERDSCLQFVNHSTTKEDNSTSYRELTDGSFDVDLIKIQGQSFWEIENVYQCTNAGGTYEEGGQLTEFNLMYSYDDTRDLRPWRDYADVMNCVPDMLPYLEDLPYVCASAIVDEPIKTYTGAKMPDEELLALREEQWERGFPACFEFRELSTFNEYRSSHGDFNEWLSKKVRKYRKKEEDTDANYEAFLEKVYDKIASDWPRLGELVLKKTYNTLDIVQKESAYTYTVYNMFEDLGYADYTEDEMDIYLALEDFVQIKNPEYGIGMNNIEEINIWINKAFVDADSIDAGFPTFTTDVSRAKKISSVYKHTQPWSEVLNAQIKAQSVPNLPIDKTRRISFYDGNEEKTETTLNYLNMFSAENVEDVEAMFESLAEESDPEVLEWMEEINWYQLEDALLWMHMNVDEKHKYILEYYIGLKEPLIGKSRNGYELVSINADGNATSLIGAFNGDKPESEADLEWQYRSEEAIAEALALLEAGESEEVNYTDLGGLDDYKPVPLPEWLGSIQDWIGDFKNSISSFAVYDGGGLQCSSADAPDTSDSNGDGIPDTAESTIKIQISSESNAVLHSGGNDYFVVSASALQADGSINKEDSFTQMSLEIISGSDSVKIAGSSKLTTTQGVATFILVGQEAGTFQIRAKVENRSSIADSNTLSGNVTDKRIHLSTYLSETYYQAEESVDGELIQIKDSDGNIKAIFNPENGEVELREANARWAQSEEALPLRVEVGNSDFSTIYGYVFVIPDSESLVEIIDANADAKNADGQIYLLHNEDAVGIVKAKGQIILNTNYYLDFADSSVPNIYDPIKILNDTGVELFEVEIKHSYSELTDLILSSEEFEYAEYANLFTDLDSNHEAFEEIINLFLRGVIKGFSDGSFRPDDFLTREEFVKINLGALCVTCDAFEQDYLDLLMNVYEQDAFPDTDINPELLACVAEAKGREIISGYGAGADAGYFVPKKSISRAEAIKVLIESAGLSVGAIESSDDAWYMPYILSAHKNKLFPSGRFEEIDSYNSLQFFIWANGSSEFKTWVEAEISRAEFAIMAMNLIQSEDCLIDDSAGAGYLEVDNVDNTNSTKSLSDYDFSFDSDFSLEYDSGVYALGDSVNYEQVVDVSGIGTGTVNLFTNRQLADGESTLFVRAELRDESGYIYTDDQSSTIEFILSDSIHGTLISEKAQVKNGVAETVFQTSTKSGEIELEARIADSSIPSKNSLLDIYAGEPVSIGIVGASSVLPAGAENTSKIRVELYDSFGNLANNGFYKVSLEADADMQILDLYDEDSSLDGTQITTSEGYVEFRVLASPEVGIGTITASLPEVLDSSNKFFIEHFEGLKINVKNSASFMLAGTETAQSIEISATDAFGREITEFNGQVSLSLSDPFAGAFGNEEITLTNGKANVDFYVGTLAGDAKIIAESSGFESGSVNIKVYPSSTYELQIRHADGETELKAGESANFIIEAFDVYGNLAITDSTTSGTIRLTESTFDFGTLSKETFALSRGRAGFAVKVADISGILNIVASADSLLAGTWSGNINYSISGEDFAEIEPQMLYGSVLGANFGDVTEENYIGGWLTFNGKTQALTSLISEPNPKEKRASISSQGKISVSETSLINLNVLSASGDLPMRFQLRNYPSESLIGEIIYSFPAGVKIASDLLSTSENFELEIINNEWILREDSEVVLKVETNGQVILNDKNYQIYVNNESEFLSLLIAKGTNQILKIDYSAEWNKDVELLASTYSFDSWKTLASGIYVKSIRSEENNFKQVPSGNSSLNNKALALIDPNKTISNSQDKDESLGWEGENKHLLLYSAGNNVGDSNLFYASEISVVLGDPTIKLIRENEVNDAGFTQDIGSMVHSGSKEILQMLEMDYNNDGQEDVLLAYANGEIDVLQNLNSFNRLQNQGTILKIANGIRSIDSGDFNGDGLEDLLVVTETSCYADEMCLYIYENIGGGFIAQNLSIDEIEAKPVQVKVVDLNNDGYSDLVLVDENMVLYVAWNHQGEIKSVDKIKDFGLHIEESENLYGDVLIHYNEMSDGTSSLPIQSTQTISPSIDADLQEFINNLDLSETYTLEVDGVDFDGETVTRTENISFEKANNSTVASEILLSKSMKDSNGDKLKVGDTVEVKIAIKNSTGSKIDDFYLSDQVYGIYKYNSGTLVCSNCDETNGNPNINSATASRPFVFGPLILENEEVLNLEYEMTVQSLPELKLLIGNNLQSDYLDDDYQDIAVSLEGNTDGQMMIYYSSGSLSINEGRSGFLGLGSSGYKKIIYTEKDYSKDTYEEETEDIVEDDIFKDSDGDGIPDLVELLNIGLGVPVPPAGSYDPIKEVFGGEDIDGNGFYSMEELYGSTEDADNDGINDSIDNWVMDSSLLTDPALDLVAWSLRDTDISIESDSSALLSVEVDLKLFDEEVEMISQVIEDIVSTFTCNGGCIAMPGSISFLTPGMFHDPLTGTVLGPDPGIPIFGLFSTLPIVCTGSACYASNILRVYLSPTTTLGLGFGLCLGVYPKGQCFAFSIPVTKALGICDAINGAMANVLSKVTSFTDGVNQVFNSNESSNLSGEWDPTGLGSNIFSTYQAPVVIDINIQVPGFPAVFTEWWKKQKLEFFKMLDLPDITFIYPTGESFTNEFSMVGGGQIKDLKSFVNFAHSLPLINIKPETVNIYYPDLTSDEIELFKREATDWIEDTQDEIHRFLGMFCLELDGEKGARVFKETSSCVGKTLDAVTKEALLKFVGAVDDAIVGLEANFAVIESYGQIPRQILEIRNLQTYYAKVIVCYLDVLLNNTAGYLLENSKKIEAWAQWLIDMKSIIKGWKILLDASVKFMKSCDKCTNQRYDTFQLLFSLFVFVPEFPVIELPKLPDIVIDTSHIQAGIDVVWPDIKFKGVPIKLPTLPRIVLPRTDINLDFDINLEIPVLPSFDMNFELPQLPGLSFPELPSIPAPPAIPEIHPAIKSAINIASNVLKIVCLIRSGFIPVPESALKTRIEDITQRPAGIFLPVDLQFDFEWPGFRRDFIERIEISTYLNLTFDTTILFDLVDLIGEASKEFIGDGVKEVNDSLNSLEKLLESIVKPLSEVKLEVDGEIEVDLDLTSYHPAVETAKQYQSHPLVKGNLMSLSQSMLNLQDSIDSWAETLPEGNIELQATQRFLAQDDPLLNRYDEIAIGNSFDKNFLNDIKDSPLAGIANMRDGLISYIDQVDNGTRILEGLDEQNYTKYLAEESELINGMSLANVDSQDGLSTSDLFKPENFANTEDVLLAEESEELNFDTAPYAYNDGIYIYNESAGVAEKLIAYSQESGSTVHVLFIDVDNDGDEDILYSLGSDVYLKKNHEESSRTRYFSSDPISYSVSELSPTFGTVKNFKAGKTAYQEAGFGMNSAKEIVGYEVSFYDSLDAINSEPDSNIKRMLLMDDSNSESVWVNQISGNASIQNSYERIAVKANGEIQTDSDVLLEALENTKILVTNDSGEEEEISLSENEWIDLQRDPNRTVRIESGSVIWVNKQKTLESQDLIEGTHIYTGEEIILENERMQVTLETSSGALIELDKEESFSIENLINKNNPSASIQIENGAYYTKMRGIYSDGSFGTLSDNILLNPQICGDTSAPYPIVNTNNGVINIPLFKTQEVSAERSFDSESEIYSAEWDFESDGIVDAIGLTTEIGPYQDTDPKELTLTVYDMAGNSSSIKIDVNIYVPDLTVESATTTEVSGISDPAIDEYPFYLVRERLGVVNEIGSGQYLTNANGEFIVNDLVENELLNVIDLEGNTIAQFNPLTRQVIVQDPNYEVIFMASENDWPSRLSVYEKRSGIILGSFVIIADFERSIVVSPNKLDRLNLSAQSSPTVYFHVDRNEYVVSDSVLSAYDLDDELEFRMSSDANIYILNEDRYEIIHREADSLNDYLILELYDNGELELEIWVGGPNNVNIQNSVDLGLSDSQRISIITNPFVEEEIIFEDISEDDPLYEDIYDLVQKGILEGVKIDEKRFFLPENKINRAEFSKIILEILCIEPRSSAYDLPNVFNDILTQELWYYAYTKEAFLSDLITGYLGETDSNNMAPFKPNNTITRAEAVKIIIEALILTEVIDGVDETIDSELWYAPYIEKAKELGIISEEEALNPNHVISRYEFVEMSINVLEANNCFDLIQEDEFEDVDFFTSEPGIYAITEECISCPCFGNIDWDTDIKAGDKIFAIIRDEVGRIFGISNKVTIK